MPATDWWPSTWAGLVAFFQNLHTQAGTHAATLGLTPGQLGAIATDRDMVIAMNDACNASNAYKEECTAYREIVVNAPLNTPLPAPPTLPPAFLPALGALAAIQARTRKLAEQIKAHNNYSVAIGQSLGIVGASSAPQDVRIVSAAAQGGSQVLVQLFMAGNETVAVFRRRGGGGFEQIGISNQATFLDTAGPLVAGQPETREYRCQAYVDNQLTGPLSDIVLVVTVP